MQLLLFRPTLLLRAVMVGGGVDLPGPIVVVVVVVVMVVVVNVRLTIYATVIVSSHSSVEGCGDGWWW